MHWVIMMIFTSNITDLNDRATTPVRRFVCTLDSLLRRAYRIQEFSRSEDCILRLALGRSKEDVILPDGTRITKGEPIGELHLWNEHIPPMPAKGPDFGWGLMFYRRLIRSLRELAVYVEHEPKFKAVRAFRGEIAFDPQAHRRPALFARLGFDFMRPAHPSPLRRFGDFWENLYAWSLIWTFNPGSLRSKRFWRLERCQLWISRQALLERYGDRGVRGGMGCV